LKFTSCVAEWKKLSSKQNFQVAPSTGFYDETSSICGV